ncbi:hypothetical protein IG631_16698 [Alternaria alternata]|nr:hypothetical protein IG631_16698 [Alternaria alternata]
MFNYSTTTLLIPGHLARIFFAISRKGIVEIDTPKGSRIKGAAEYMDAKGIPYSHNDLFKFHDFSKEKGLTISKQDSRTADRRHEHSESTTETGGESPF